jgi:hypothetical protein
VVKGDGRVADLVPGWESTRRAYSGTYDAMLQAADGAATRNEYYTRSIASVLDDAYYVELHAWQYETLVRLGQPSQAQAVYDAWLANFRQRVLMDARV